MVDLSIYRLFGNSLVFVWGRLFGGENSTRDDHRSPVEPVLGPVGVCVGCRELVGRCLKVTFILAHFGKLKRVVCEKTIMSSFGLCVPDSKVAQPLPGLINIQDFIPFSPMTWGERFVPPQGSSGDNFWCAV